MHRCRRGGADDRPGYRPGNGEHRLGRRRAGRQPARVAGLRLHRHFGAASTPRRLRQIHDRIGSDHRALPPTVVALEELFVSVNVKTALAVGHAGAPHTWPPPIASSPVRLYAGADQAGGTGYGRASKIQVQEMTKALLGLSQIPQPDHAADALAVAICHAHAPQTAPRRPLRRVARPAAGRGGR